MVQQMPVCHAGHADLLFLTFHALGGEQDVQHRVSGLVLRLILQNAVLHLCQRRVLLGAVPLGTDISDLDLQFMVAAVDELDALLAALVLFVLPVQHIVHGRKLLMQRALPQLLVLQRQDQHPAEIHQRADAEHVHGRRALPQKQKVADHEHRARHDKCRQRSLVADVQMLFGQRTAALQPEHQAVDRAVDRRQQRQRQRVKAAPVREQPAVQLPFCAGSKLCQQKRPGGDVQCLQPVDRPAAPQVPVEQQHRAEHTGHPPRQRHIAGLVQKDSQHQCPHHRDRGLPVEPPRQAAGVEQHRQHLCQRRVQAGDARQHGHEPSPPM